jgi:hypothetical protein
MMILNASRIGKNAVAALIVAILVVPPAALGQQPRSLEQVKKEEELAKKISDADRLIRRLDDAKAAANNLAHARQFECEKAVGNSTFCGCLGQNLPFTIGFLDFVAITTRTKEQNGYSKLSLDQTKAYDAVAGVRDQCVRLSTTKKQ